MKFKDLPIDATFRFSSINTESIEIDKDTAFQKYNIDPPQAILSNPIDIDPELEVELVD